MMTLKKNRLYVITVASFWLPKAGSAVRIEKGEFLLYLGEVKGRAVFLHKERFFFEHPHDEWNRYLKEVK